MLAVSSGGGAVPSNGGARTFAPLVVGKHGDLYRACPSPCCLLLAHHGVWGCRHNQWHQDCEGRRLRSSLRRGVYEMGLFSPSSSKSRYLGIWFKKVQVQNVVWVENRGRSLEVSGGVLKFSESGNRKAEVVVLSSSVTASAHTPVAQLLVTVNLVIRDENRNRSSDASYLWQSFDEPVDTLIAGMMLGVNKKTGATQHLTSWKTTADPSPGNFTMNMNIRNLPHLVLLEGSTVKWNSGPWKGITFSGLPDINSSDIFQDDVLFDEQEDH